MCAAYENHHHSHVNTELFPKAETMIESVPRLRRLNVDYVTTCK